MIVPSTGAITAGPAAVAGGAVSLSGTPSARPQPSAASTPAAPAAPPLLATSNLAPLTLGGLTALQGAAPAEERQEKEGRALFLEAAKRYFAEALGLSPQEVRNLQLNDEALRYLIRNTVFGALATPGQRRELGLGFGGRFAEGKGYGNGLAEISLTIGGAFGGRARQITIAFDPGIMESIARLPRRQKDVDGDRLFTPLDLLPGSRQLRPGQQPPGDMGSRFRDISNRHQGGSRAAIADDRNRTFFFVGTDSGTKQLAEAAAGLAFGLLQFARTWGD